MNLDELQSVQSRERQTDSLQQLRSSFYEDAAEFVAELRAERNEVAAAADDPFQSPRVARLSDDIATAERTVAAIYDRRVGKVVKMASLAAADMPTDRDGLTNEEQALFDRLVAAIEDNRDAVLGAVQSGSSPDVVPDAAARADQGPAVSQADGPSPTADAASTASDAASPGSDAASRAGSDDPFDPDPAEADTSEADASEADDGVVDAADAMGAPAAESAPGDGEDSTTDTAGPSGGTEPPGPPPEALDDDRIGDTASAGDSGDATPADGTGAATDDATDQPASADDGSTPRSATDPAGNGADPADQEVDRTTVKLTEDVGVILGVDRREYDLASDDVVSLPVENADPLVERDAAQPLE